MEEEEEEVVEVEEEVDEEEEEVVEVEEEEVDGEEEEVLEVEEEVEEEDEDVVEAEEFVRQKEEEKADEEMQEGGDGDANDKVGNGGKDDEEEARDDRIGSDMKDDKEAKGEDQDADEEMQVANEEESAEDGKKASLDKDGDANMEEERSTKEAKDAYQGAEEDTNMEDAASKKTNMEDEHNTNMEEAVTKKASAMQAKEGEPYGVKKEAHEEEGAKNVTNEEAAVAKDVSQDQVNRSLPCGFSDRAAGCTNMDAQRLAKLLFTNTGLNSEIHAALHGASDAAALALDVIELFLHDNMLKTNKSWVNCVGLIRMVPVIVTELSADTIEQAKPVAKNWKEMIDNSECSTVLGSLASWGLLYFLISYNIVSEFETKEIFHLFGTMPRKQQKMNHAMLFKGLRLTDRIPELMDYLIENGQHMDVLYWARVFNLVDKYPPVSLLKGYVEKAKQTAIEISQNNMTHQSLSMVIKELDNLRRAQDLAEKQIADSSLSTSIRAEINGLLEEFGKRKRSLAKSYAASTSNSQQQHTECNKKHKKEQELHEGQERQQQRQQSKPGEKLEQKIDKSQQKQQQKKQDKLQEKQQQSKQQHAKWSRQRTPKLPAQASPTSQNTLLRGHFGNPPYVAIHGINPGYPAQPGWPGVPCLPPFAPQLGAPEYIIPFNPFYPHPECYPW